MRVLDNVSVLANQYLNETASSKDPVAVGKKSNHLDSKQAFLAVPPETTVWFHFSIVYVILCRPRPSHDAETVEGYTEIRP